VFDLTSDGKPENPAIGGRLIHGYSMLKEFAQTSFRLQSMPNRKIRRPAYNPSDRKQQRLRITRALFNRNSFEACSRLT
jgi:hypothetical protein